MSVCGGWSLVKHGITGTKAITLWCRSWGCPDCLPHRVRALKQLAAAGHPTTFLTLTVNPARGQSPTDRARELSDAFKILVKRARRKFCKVKLEYLAVFEETRRGEPHLHILMRAPYIPQRWLSDTMAELIDAPIVDIRSVHGARHVAVYIAKYVGKGPKAFGTLKRYWTSQGYDSHPKGVDRIKPEFGSQWYPVKRPLWLLASDYTDAGYLVIHNSDHRIFVPNGAKGDRWRSRVAWSDIRRTWD